MKKKTPSQAAEAMRKQLANIEKAKTLTVKVGILSNGAGSGVYENGKSVLDIGMIHEYGSDNMDIPQRSFLRTPFFVNRDKMNNFINKQFKAVLEKGKDAEVAMELIGVKAQSISQGAFSNEGYGFWVPLKPETIKRKGSSAILIDTGTLRNSITYAVSK